ncbi:large ribosomal subunit protein mL51-like [Tubulanus polymorphus]|uniref:large ribosomal subunit protein mL51-like n=1 Tax=Tubulanus polymorphus TaxID=672921 RepID=UPI003DA2CC94
MLKVLALPGSIATRCRQQLLITINRLSSSYDNKKTLSSSSKVYDSKSPQLNEVTRYEAYEDFAAPSPYKKPGPRRHGFRSNYYTGGPMPRLDGPDVKPLPHKPVKIKTPWQQKKSFTFGQNDYIDILGEGTLKPRNLIRGPQWLIGFRGNELQRLVRRMNFEGEYLKEFYPTNYHSMAKRVHYVYKRYNRRRHRYHGHKTSNQVRDNR